MVEWVSACNPVGRISSSDYSLTNLPGAALEAVLNDSNTHVLQSPQIRSVDNVKATLKIGDRIRVPNDPAGEGQRKLFLGGEFVLARPLRIGRQSETRDDVVGRLRPLLDLPVGLVLPAHGEPTDRAALEHALS